MEEVIKEKLRVIILEKINEKYKYKVAWTDKNPNFEDSHEMNNFKIAIRNKANKKQKTFYYSMGRGIKETDDENVLIAFLSSALNDVPYTDLNLFDDLGYTGKQAITTYKNICKEVKSLNELDLINFLENELTEQEKELLQ